ncbi:flagellin [Rhodopila sp.]|uniref:flagellin N-terminal helical domain-containing protein n=1 Tax=Rhodopila sp. TaxID=2480087 RepID=UPI003D142318
MSGGIGGISQSGYGIMGQLTANSQSLRNQVDTLTEQASTGLVSQSYAGLGAGASVALNLNPQIASLQTWQTNINQATSSMTVSQSALTQLQSIASTFYADMNNLSGANAASGVSSTAAQARSALQQVAGLLDTQDGNVYVFGGADSTSPPVPAADSILTSGFYTQINSAVSSLSTNGSTATIAATLSIGQSNAAGTSPFSAYMSQPTAGLAAPVVQVGTDSTVQIGLLASANSFANSSDTSTSTTGSYMRDLMRSLATIGSMTSAQVSDPNFSALVQDTRTSLNGVVSAMGTDIGALGNNQSNLTTIQTQLSDTQTALTSQVSDVQQVDMAQTLSELTQTNTQLQASYQLIASENTLSLAKFLPAA